MAELWYHDHGVVISLAEALTNAEVLEDASDVIALLKKPMKYKAYYEAWEAADFPTNEEDDGWDDFAEAVGSNDDESE